MKLLDQYSPLELLHRPLTIFNREVKGMRWLPTANLVEPRKVDMRQISEFIAFSIVIGLISGSIAIWILAPVTLIGAWLVGVVADLYAVSNAILFWRTRTQDDTLDMLRLTMPTDEDLLNTLHAVAELAAWRLMRWETILRSFASVVAFIICLFLGGVAGAALATVSTARELASIALTVCALVWVVQLAILYVREPLWRMRAMVALGITIASRTHDGNSGILIASGIALGLKLLQLTVVVVLIIGTISLFGFDRIGRELERSVLLIAGSVIVPWLVRRVYDWLHAWCIRVTLHTMQGGE